LKIPGADHPITVQPTDGRVTVRAGSTVVADTTRALTMQESTYPAVLYVPLADVDASLLRESPTSTHCPYKGDASYFHLSTPAGEIDDAIWTYREPYPAVAEIAGHVAFYPQHVEVSTTRIAEEPSEDTTAR
jgi:uncharacterized protein (DUF427 family)